MALNFPPAGEEGLGVPERWALVAGVQQAAHLRVLLVEFESLHSRYWPEVHVVRPRVVGHELERYAVKNITALLLD